MNNTEKWTWKVWNIEIWINNPVGTRDEAIKRGIEKAKLLGLDRFSIGKCEDAGISLVDHVNILEYIQDHIEDHIYCEHGEAASDWYENLPDDDVNLLKKMLNDTCVKWFEITENNPNLYNIVDIEEIVIEEES